MGASVVHLTFPWTSSETIDPPERSSKRRIEEDNALTGSAPCTQRVLLVIVVPEVTGCALEVTLHYKITTKDVYETMPMTGSKSQV